jgi:hypothetical protein
MRRTFATLLLSAALAATLAAQDTPKPRPKTVAGAVAPSWAQMEKTVRSKWAETYPKEKILQVDKVGEPTFNDEPGKTESSSTTSGSFDWDSFTWNETTWNTTTKGREGSYLRQKVDVTVERANQTRARFHTAALYKLAGKQWQFVEMPAGKVAELGGPNAAGRPTKTQAAELFQAGWTSARPDFTVRSVDILGEEYHQYKDRQWITYKLAVHVTGKQGKRAGKDFKCEPADYSSQLKFNPESKSWAAEEKDIANVNEDGVCEEE